MGLLKRLKRYLNRDLTSYLGPLDLIGRVTEDDQISFRHLQAFQMLEDVWILDQDGSDKMVIGRIMGVGIGLSGRPFYLVGYWNEHYQAFDVTPYHGPIRKIKYSERQKGVQLHAVK